jgi:hypothetical protein
MASISDSASACRGSLTTSIAPADAHTHTLPIFVPANYAAAPIARIVIAHIIDVYHNPVCARGLPLTSTEMCLGLACVHRIPSAYGEEGNDEGDTWRHPWPPPDADSVPPLPHPRTSMSPPHRPPAPSSRRSDAAA